MSNRVHEARERSKRHCGHAMLTWRTTVWAAPTKRYVPVRHYVCTHCGHRESVKL